MADLVKPLSHVDGDKNDDAALRQEAAAQFARTPTVQLVAELLAKLRATELPWWTPELLREWWPATERLRWFQERPDLRQKITSELTGLVPKSARKKSPEFQGSLIDSAIEDGDVTVRVFEEAFSPVDVSVYAPVGDLWRKLREKFPWDQDTPVHQRTVHFLVSALLADKSSLEGATRKPLLTPWEVRTAIPPRIWHMRIPIETRIAIDEARLQREQRKPGEPFRAADELAVATLETVTSSIPLRDFAKLLDVAEKAMGLDSTPHVRSTRAKEPTVAAEAPPPKPAEPPKGTEPPKRGGESLSPDSWEVSSGGDDKEHSGKIPAVAARR